MKDIILFFDSGDTLVDESTEIRDHAENPEIVTSAELFPGAKQAVREAHEAGYRIALVADGWDESFRNVYRQHELEDCFEARSISELVGTSKPAGEMFLCAMEQMGLTEADKDRILMIGNNIERDVVGANRMGIRSVLAAYSPRYRMQPRNEEETPDYVLAENPLEILELVEVLDRQYRNRKILIKETE